MLLVVAGIAPAGCLDDDTVVDTGRVRLAAALSGDGGETSRLSSGLMDPLDNGPARSGVEAFLLVVLLCRPACQRCVCMRAAVQQPARQSVDDDRVHVLERAEEEEEADLSLSPAGQSPRTMDIDIDNSGDSDAGNLSSSSSSSSNIQAALIPSTSAADSLGGSISRAARLRATTTDDEQQDDELEDTDEDDDDVHAAAASDGDNLGGPRLPNSSHQLTKPAHSQARPSAFVTAARGERYLLQASKPAKTSAAKLSDVFSRPCSQSDLVKLLARQSVSPKGKATERQLRVIEHAYIQLFSQWKTELAAHFKLLFYGLGSKIRLLNLFVQIGLRSAVAAQRIVLVDGFRAETSLLDVVVALENILVSEQERRDDPLYASKSAARIDERVAAILQKLDNAEPANILSTKPLYLLVHSIDGLALRSPRFQATLWTLSNHPNVRLIASFDHAKAPLLFPASTTNTIFSSKSTSTPSHRGVIYHHTPTLRPYTIEALASGTMAALYPSTVFLSDLHLLQGKQGGLRGASSSARAKAAFFVLASLTQKAKDLFSMMATRQIALADSDSLPKETTQVTPIHAMPYASIFAAARDGFLANNVGQMEALLRELRDHEIVLSSNVAPALAEMEMDVGGGGELGQRSTEWMWINIDAADLLALLDRLQN